MAASLQRMSVPDSDTANSNQTLLMPKLKYRFRVFFDNFGTSGSGSTLELTRQVMDFTRPNVTFENIDLPVYNSTVKIAGKYAWQDVTCQLRDDASGNISRLVGEQIQKQLDFVEMSSASAGFSYKFLTRFQVLDGGNGAAVPVVLEEWELGGCYLQAVNYNSADYASNEVMTVSMIIRFDNAQQTVISGSVKQNIATGTAAS